MTPAGDSTWALVELINEGRLAEVEERARALLRAHSSDGMLWKILSVALLRQDKDALAALLRAAELLPQDAEAHANLGGELRRRGQWENALTSLRQSLALQPKNPDALVDAADAQRSLGRPREAVTLYHWALQIDPSRSDVHNNLGNAFLQLGQNAEAARCYRRALKMRPESAQVLCNLGNALRALGEFDEATAYTRRAIELAPGLSMAHNNLGLLLAGRGERAAAIRSYREALLHDTRYIEALNNLGNALREEGQTHEALTVLQQAVELDPRRAESHSNLGNVLLESRRVNEAADSFRNALSLQPDNVAAYLGQATAQRVQGLAAAAEESCNAALTRAAQRPDVLLLLGELRADRGQFVEAQALFERARAADQMFAPAYSSIAAHRRMTRDDTEWLSGTLAVLAKPLPLDQEIQLRYALGKYFDDVGEYDQAFNSYRDANELTKRYGGRYDSTRLTALIERIMKLCDASFVRTTRPAANASPAPVFIVGMPRSGTSLAEQILASHPMVFGAGEVRFWDRAFATLEEAARAGNNLDERIGGVAEEYLRGIRERVAAAASGSGGTGTTSGAGVGTTAAAMAAAAAATSHAAASAATDTTAVATAAAAPIAIAIAVASGAGNAPSPQRTTDKMPANFLYAGLIHAIFPGARIIHMQRDPLDTCLSIYFQNFFNVSPYANDLDNLAQYYEEYLRIMAHWRNVLPEHALLEVPYEGLVEDPEGWTRRMLEFIGLPWDPKCLEFHQTDRVVITASKWQVRQKISASSIGRWRNYEKHVAPLRHLVPCEMPGASGANACGDGR
jgi:tetratricopeptide (TPR) repeat protein